jgi:hypothetical protein
MKTNEFAPFDSYTSSVLARASCQYSYYKIQQQIIESSVVWCCVVSVWPIDFHAWLVRLYKKDIFTKLCPGALQLHTQFDNL